MKISIIVAVGNQNQIGLNDTLPWKNPEDLKNFRKLTMGYPMLMGRKTYDSIGRPLPGRTSIIMTQNPSLLQNLNTPSSCIYVPNFDEGVAYAKNILRSSKLFVIGGSQVFTQALPLCQTLHLTEVDYSGPGDVFFSEWKDSAWETIEELKFEGAIYRKLARRG